MKSGARDGIFLRKLEKNERNRTALPAAINWSPAVDKVTSIHGDQQMLETREWGGEMTVMNLERRGISAAKRRGGGNGAF